MAENGVKGFLRDHLIFMEIAWKAEWQDMGTASAAEIPPFHYRNNRDGTIDSICPLCFLTVATAKRPEELRARELAHICERFDPFASKQN